MGSHADKSIFSNSALCYLKHTVSERGAGLGFLCKIKCIHCDNTNVMRTDEVHSDESKRGPKISQLNERCVLGTLHSGSGHAQMEHFFAPLDVECMTSATYKRIERRVGKQLEKVSNFSCTRWRDEEKERSEERSELAISYDMGWQKRGTSLKHCYHLPLNSGFFKLINAKWNAFLKCYLIGNWSRNRCRSEDWNNHRFCYTQYRMTM